MCSATTGVASATPASDGGGVALAVSTETRMRTIWRDGPAAVVVTVVVVMVAVGGEGWRWRNDEVVHGWWDDSKRKLKYVQVVTRATMRLP